MASSVSPGAALLRSSRLFAMPKAQPELMTNVLASETATRNVPQYQAITSPLSSREKGDWGLKRPLPLKQTMATTTPLVKIRQFDSIEKITDYGSAADHVMSLEKFGEMRVAMTVPVPQSRNIGAFASVEHDPLRSVFEEDVDILTNDRSKEAVAKRWKFNGPWLAMLSEGEFKKFMRKQVQPRRSEFRTYLREVLAQKMTNEARHKAREDGSTTVTTTTVKDVTDAEFDHFVRTLRDSRAELYGYVSDFLDLPPVTQVGVADAIYAKANSEFSPYGMNGPPPSHPSAGIGYLRTTAFMENHPVYGPQEQKTPTLTRIVRPRHKNAQANIGVGGFIAEIPAGSNEFTKRMLGGRYGSAHHTIKGIQQLDLDTYGGAKAYVEPSKAIVNSRGSVVISTNVAKEDAKLIADEKKGFRSIYNNKEIRRTKAAAAEEKERERAAQLEEAKRPETDILGSSETYGLS
ncbi:37S ribosomal protein-like protein [Emericellopsis cladophorae]|uniref:37S ribosomal protein-like protein n=1 Tax=Emericellopsis cladophorae TaxID=2686198 RepID=A0A9Q0BD78_9HYPO|nr:37S ribosomal protein-like protein [Emericellopsis cladophorae]KAI6779899.1 37S ribosomal protein-like protein [Emericellopsis cladophorae]